MSIFLKGSGSDEYYFIEYDVDNLTNDVVNDVNDCNATIRDKIISLMDINFGGLVEIDANDTSSIKSKTFVGPIKSFESVFSNQIKGLLNSQMEEVLILKIEQLRVFSKGDTYDEMLEELYDYTYFKSPNTIQNNNPDLSLQLINLEEADLSKLNKTLAQYGIGFDNAELQYYKQMFATLKRTPTLIELYDLCQSNSEHSRHWFFRGKYIIEIGRAHV